MTSVAEGLTTSGQYQFDTGKSFLEATTIKKGNRDSEYVAEIPPDWCFGPVAHGGYLAGLLSRAVHQHLQYLAATSQRPLPDTPGSSNIAYLAPVLPGPVDIKIETKSLTRSSGYFLATLYQVSTDPKTGIKSSPTIRTEASIFMTASSSMTKTTISAPMTTRTRLPAAEIYQRQSAGHHSPHADSAMPFYKFKPGWECYFNPTSADRPRMLNVHGTHGPSVFDVWWTFDHAITPHELGFLADLIGPVLFNYEDVRKTHWLSTRQMSTEVVRLPKGGETGWRWLFCRMELIENAGDRFYCDVTMADEQGNVVGIARQSCVVRPFALVGKSKKEVKEEAKAKI